MSKVAGQFPLGPANEKVNIAVQRPTVNVREAENIGEQMAAANRQKGVPGVSSQPIGSKLAKNGWGGGGHLHKMFD
jgi:hypothetical protein